MNVQIAGGLCNRYLAFRHQLDRFNLEPFRKLPSLHSLPPVPKTSYLDVHQTGSSSGVDALSLAQIEGRRDTLYVSTGGSVGQRTIAELKALIDRHPGIKVCLGFDNDAPGDLFAASVAEKLGYTTDRLRPSHKDWNDDLHLKSRNGRDVVWKFGPSVAG